MSWHGDCAMNSLAGLVSRSWPYLAGRMSWTAARGRNPCDDCGCLAPLLAVWMSRARIQIKKSEEELTRGWGTGPVAAPGGGRGRGRGRGRGAPPTPAPAQKPAAEQRGGEEGSGSEEGEDAEDGGEEGPDKGPLTTIQIFGEAKAVEIAVRMIDEAVQNKEQKAKQRAKAGWGRHGLAGRSSPRGRGVEGGEGEGGRHAGAKHHQVRIAGAVWVGLHHVELMEPCICRGAHASFG